MKFAAASVTNSGPRSENEDSVGCWADASGALIAAVADGLGGMGGGARASQLALRALKIASEQAVDGIAGLMEGARAAHDAIVAAQRESPEYRQMATTLTAGRFAGNRLAGVHCGDTRVALARKSGIKRLTSDHSEGLRLYNAGKLSKEELSSYPRRHILDSALGITGVPHIDEFSIDLYSGDRVVFTTDGAHEIIKLREMRSILVDASNPDEFVAEMERQINSRSAKDNFSIISIFCL